MSALPSDVSSILDVEHALLGSLILDHTKLASVSDLELADFPSDRGATLFSAMQFLAQNSGAFDLPILTEHLARNDRLKEFGSDYIGNIMADGVGAVDVRHYARDLRRYRIRAEARAVAAHVLATNADGAELDALRARIPAELDDPMKATQAPNVWDTAKTVDELLALGGTEIDWLLYPRIARGHVTKVFAPRGTGKSLDAMYQAIQLARAGLRVLYIDRDNSPQLAVKRAVGFGSCGVLTFHLMTRKTAPPLKKTQEWAKLAQQEYDLVVIDSWDSFAEGSGEASDHAANAMAPLLDLARGDDGPAISILGNTTKSASHGRGSGVINDRLDIEFEARDITGWKPTGERPWHEEIPDGGVDFWASRATRRQRKDVTKIRLAFVNTKWRVDGDDPAPFAVEIDSSTTPWTERDITDELVAAGDEALTAAVAERQAKLDAATEALKAEILRRAAADEPLILKEQAGAFLQALNLKRKAARDLLAQGTAWTFLALDKKSMALVLPSPPALRTAQQVVDLTLRGFDGVGPWKFPSGEPCGFIGCVLHPKILTTTAAFFREESPLESRSPEDTNVAEACPLDGDIPNSESPIGIGVPENRNAAEDFSKDPLTTPAATWSGRHDPPPRGGAGPGRPGARRLLADGAVITDGAVNADDAVIGPKDRKENKDRKQLIDRKAATAPKPEPADAGPDDPRGDLPEEETR